MSGSAGSERSERVDALEERLERFRAFRGLRRSLRELEEVEEIAAAAQRFALDVLCCSHFAVYCAEKEEADFVRIAADATSRDVLPSIVERPTSLEEALERASFVREHELLDRLKAPLSEAVAVALRASPTQLIGFAIVAESAAATERELDEELLDELAFDLESALSARMIARLRAEELAVLEIQERELVGLLRDVEARDEIIQRDLEEARLFQRKMLGAPPAVSGASIEVVYKPLGLVGGDLYAVSVDGDRLRLFVADATGHGVRASLTTMFIKSGYEAVRLAAPDPAALLAALNDTIAHTYRSSEMLFSAACVDIDLATGRVLTSSAAHPAVCVVRGGQASFIEGGGAFLGLRSGMKFATNELHVKSGDGVYLYTDGFLEARRQSELFGDDRLKQAVLEAHVEARPAGAAVLASVLSFLEDTPLDDDGTFVGVRYGAEAPTPEAIGGDRSASSIE